MEVRAFSNVIKFKTVKWNEQQMITQRTIDISRKVLDIL